MMPGIAEGSISLISNLIGNKQQSKNIDKQIKAQQQENQKTRDYNFRLAQYQNDQNIQQWQRENEYNSPYAQMQRFKDAGLNPDLMMSNGASSLAASSPTLTAGSPAISADMSALGQKPTIGQAFAQSLANLSEIAQIKQTEKQNKILDKEFDWKDLVYGNQINLNNSVIEINKHIADMKPLEKQLLQKELVQMDKNLELLTHTIQESISRQKNLDEQSATELFRRHLLAAQRDNVIADTDLKEFELHKERMMLPINMLLGNNTAIKIGREMFILKQEGKNWIFRNGDYAERHAKEMDVLDATESYYRAQSEGKEIDNEFGYFNHIVNNLAKILDSVVPGD